MTLESANYTPGDAALRVQAPPTPVSMQSPSVTTFMHPQQGRHRKPAIPTCPAACLLGPYSTYSRSLPSLAARALAAGLALARLALAATANSATSVITVTHRWYRVSFTP